MLKELNKQLAIEQSEKQKAVKTFNDRISSLKGAIKNVEKFNEVGNKINSTEKRTANTIEDK